MTYMNLLLSMICMLLSVAYYTIMERKLLSYIQIRKGPNKVGFMGLLQPFSDGIKLFNKNLITLEMMNFFLSFTTPLMTIIIPMMMISIISFNSYSMMDNKQNMLFFFILSSMSVYMIMLIGWSSNSKYCFLGSIRSVAQMISYEVSLFLIILFISIMSHSYSFMEISNSQNLMWFMWGNIILTMMWLTTCLAEVNRSPFDFAEGESELVSGFNVEYMGGWFALIFLAEYSSMLILSFLTVILFFKSLNSIPSMIILLITTMFLLWIRGTLPRFRFDMLMNLSWKIFLPFILFMSPLSMILSLMYF